MNYANVTHSPKKKSPLSPSISLYLSCTLTLLVHRDQCYDPFIIRCHIIRFDNVSNNLLTCAKFDYLVSGKILCPLIHLSVLFSSHACCSNMVGTAAQMFFSPAGFFSLSSWCLCAKSMLGDVVSVCSRSAPLSVHILFYQTQNLCTLHISSTLLHTHM